MRYFFFSFLSANMSFNVVGALISVWSAMVGGPVVLVKEGWLRGATVKNAAGGSHISFKGIPFAAPPVGNLRFADPQPPQQWTGVREALQEGSKCAQVNYFTKSFVGDDDCLYLNVATTSLTGSRPVMVWIHGGAFTTGNGGFDSFGPDYMMGSDIVYVGINYRLGVLGFLNLDHEAAPGNMGLKDQVAALKWVKENIAQFGGDTNNVTIFGESAGGAAVHYLLISPLAKGLFHKAISQSGVVLNAWATASETVDKARRYVAAFGKDLTDPNEIVEYLRTIPVRRLIEIQEKISPFELKINLSVPFAPGVDDKSVEAFMLRPGEELVADGWDVPLIIGYNSHEGLLFLLGIDDDAYKKLDENFEEVVPRDLAAKAPSKVPEIAAEIRKFYFGDKPITKDLVDEFVQCSGDLNFGVGIHKVVEIQSHKKSPTYFYKFSYDSPNFPTKKILQFPAKVLHATIIHTGTTHAEDLQYLFNGSLFYEDFKFELQPTEAILRDRFIRLWTDFAKTGNPTPSIDDLITEEWKPVTQTTKNYLEINAELTAGVNPNEDMWKTWKRIYAMVADQQRYSSSR